MEKMNDKIWGILNQYTEGLLSEASNEIEKFVLQSQVDILSEVYNSNSWEHDQVRTINDKISELTQQLSLLKQQ